MSCKKAKIKSKAVRVKNKVKGKRAKIAGVVVLFALLCGGCSSPASRANTQNFKDCTFTLTLPAAKPAAGGAAKPDAGGAEDAPGIGDLFSQNMVVENSGSESTAQPYTVAPNVPVSVPLGAGGGESLAGLIGSVLGGGKAAAAGERCADCAEK